LGCYYLTPHFDYSINFYFSYHFRGLVLMPDGTNHQ
jgi:hypothetical protein